MGTFYLSIILLLFGSSACKTDVLSPKEELPAATQEGLNTFGCLVNGEVWKPRAVLSNEFTYYYHEKTLNIAAFRKIGSQNINQGLGFRIEKNLFTPFEFILSDYKVAGASFSDINKSCYYETNPEQTGTLTITKLDTVNHIIAGTFAFTLWTEVCDTIKVTDGRFDIKYQQ